MSLSGTKRGYRLMIQFLRLVMVLIIVLVNPAFLLNLWSLRRYEKTERLVIYTQSKLMICWPIVSMGLLFACLSTFNLSPLWLGYAYLLIVLYCVYTAAEDMSWVGSAFVFLIAIAVVTVVVLLGQIYHFHVFSGLAGLLQRTHVTFPMAWALALSTCLGLIYLWKFVRRLREHRVVFDGNNVVVYFGMGEGSKDHPRSGYTIVEPKPDMNERRLGYGPIELHARSSADPSYALPTVAAVALLIPALQKLTGTTEVELHQPPDADGHHEDLG
jgi:hypothetical protein